MRPPTLNGIVAANLLGGALRRAVFANVASGDGMLSRLAADARWSPADAGYALAVVLCAAAYSVSEARATRLRRLRAELALPRPALLHCAEILIFALVIAMTKSVAPCV